MTINSLNSSYINDTTNKINKDIEKIANPSSVDKTVNQFIQDVYENDINTSLQQVNNYNEAVGFMQIADGALNSISDNLNQIKTLQVAANNATLNSDNLAAINSQINTLSQNINDTLTQTKYNNKSVFGEFNFGDLSVNTSMPEFSTDTLDTFEKSLNDARSSLGAFTNAATSKIDNLNTYITSLSAAKAQNEPDIAQSVNDMKNNEVKLNAALIAQAHNMQLSQQSLMNLLS